MDNLHDQHTHAADFDPTAEDLFIDPPGWPKVVGICSLVFAGIGLSCVGCGVLSMVVFIPMAEGQIGEPLPTVMQPGIVQWAMMGVGILSTILLITAGVMTITRKPMGRTLHLVWALISSCITLFNLFVQFSQQQRIAEWVEANPDSAWAAQGGQGSAMQYIGLAIGVVIGLAWPVFCLIWFGLIKTKQHQMTGEPEQPDPFAT